MQGETVTRVVFLARLAKEDVIKRLSSIPGVELFASEDLDQVLRALAGAQVLVTADVRGEDSRKLADALASPGRTVRWVQCVSAGFEGLVRHGFPADIPLTNQGGAVAPAVAEHAFALMLALLRRVPEAVLARTRREWDRSFSSTTSALEGRTLAIIGCGHIGRQVARRALAFDMRVIGVSRSGLGHPEADAEARARFDELHPVSALKSVLARAQAIVLAAPQTAQTRHLIGAAELAACRRDAILVNVARGGLVDPAALRAALERGAIAAAGLDVTEPEPLPPEDPLWNCPNLVITPHIAGGGSPMSRGRILDVLSENFERFRSGRALLHLVNAA
ncbi:MAG: D-2-hydroxyacid dehydrogenase [Burkholderiales bacterium]|nr:D-2-hydroxyacid dehydrogenase [Burkholderiales bacterium]